MATTLEGSFLDDLKTSAVAITQAPALAWSFLALTAIYYLGIAFKLGSLSILFLASVIILTGFSGTIRVWFMRILVGGEKLRPREVVSLTRAFIGRFIVLGFWFAVFAAAFFGVGAALSHGNGTVFLRSPVRIAGLACAMIADVALTFVVPALALSTRKVSVAFRTGIRLARSTWPSSAPYMLTPGIVLTGVGGILTKSAIGSVGVFVAGVAGGMVALLFRGAITAAYIRVVPSTDPNGAA